MARRTVALAHRAGATPCPACWSEPKPRTGITPEQIRAAASTLADRGRTPTVLAVRAELGRGSPNTIAPVLAAWWAERHPTEEPLPPVPALVEVLVKEIWAAAYRAAEDQFVAERAQPADRLDQVRAELVAERRARASLAAALVEARATMTRHHEPVKPEAGGLPGRSRTDAERSRTLSKRTDGGPAGRPP
ncbi:MAG: hypothetical protein EA400_17705 [Chromatiaceae bacterium]|nr:MAG: hypothetical protein EA400_17705 [Chromatiaceae bacterium]